jgi:hypothetical protein
MTMWRSSGVKISFQFEILVDHHCFTIPAYVQGITFGEAVKAWKTRDESGTVCHMQTDLSVPGHNDVET